MCTTKEVNNSMAAFAIKHSMQNDITQISNIFIDTFMPAANGNYVKVYLYLLRHRDTKDENNLSIHAMADLFENTEADIMRAFRYWQKVNILKMECDSEDQVISINLLPIANIATADIEYAATDTISIINRVPVSSVNTTSLKIPPMPNYEPTELAILGEDPEIQEARTIIETMMGKPITEPHLHVILYFMSELGFSVELTVQAFETALSKGKESPRYIEKIGIDWAEKKITTANEAETESANFDTHYNIIKNNMGFDRSLIPAERGIIDRWKEYHFSDVILAEACKRTVLNIGKPNLNYASKILKEWHDANVTNLSDIEKIDKGRKAHLSQKSTGTNKKNQFQDFPQRNYSSGEYSSIEKKLLQK